MDEYELLLRHATKWAQDKKRTLDADLMGTALRIRQTHDDLAPNEWPTGSIEHLMLVRWPSHGPAGAPEVDLLVTSIESFVRFLRNTGRMAHACDVSQLVKEARGAASKMADACLDSRNFGQSKSMLAFGREIGVQLDEVDDIDVLNERMAEIVAAFNALPYEERKARTDAGFQDFSFHPEPDEDDVLMPLDTAITAPEAREAPIVRRVLALAEWVGEGKPVTSTGALRPAVAREAFDHLNLLDRYRERVPELDEEELRHHFRDSWRSAWDCVELARLWDAAVITGLIQATSSRARHDPDAMPGSDDDVVGVAIAAIVIAVAMLPSVAQSAVVHLLLSILPEYGEGRVQLQTLQASWHQHMVTSLGWNASGRAWSDQMLDAGMKQMGDCGLWTVRGDWIEHTNLGRDATLAVIEALEAGVLGATS